MISIEEGAILAGFSDRSDGDLAFYLLSDEEAAARWENLQGLRNLSLNHAAYVHQVHGNKVLTVSDSGAGSWCRGEADALVTSCSDMPVGVFSADCLPILFWSEKAVGAAHAGWRGTCLDIAAATLKSFQKNLEIAPGELKAAIGPCIGSCCLELGDEVFRRFVEADPAYEAFFSKKNKWHLDLVALNRFQLIRSGVLEKNVFVFHECTYCNHDRFFSFRRQKKRNGSMFSFVVRRSSN